MECKFVVGQKVVCVVDSWDFCNFNYQGSIPLKNGIYTITYIGPGKTFSGVPTILILLKEIVVEPSILGNKIGWNHTGFRPLEDNSTKIGMDILNKLLDPIKVLEDA